MKSRWIIAGAAALSLGLLTLPLLRGRTGGEAIPEKQAAVPERAPSCDAQGTAKFDFVLKNEHNVAVKMADYKGKVVLLNFWATWCEPCREEMPSMQRLQDRLAGKPFVILAVDFGEGEPRINDFLKKVPVRFPILLDRDGAVASAWKVRVLPISFVIDANQKLRYSVRGDLDWSAPAVEATVRDLLPPGRE